MKPQPKASAKTGKPAAKAKPATAKKAARPQAAAQPAAKARPVAKKAAAKAPAKAAVKVAKSATKAVKPVTKAVQAAVKKPAPASKVPAGKSPAGKTGAGAPKAPIKTLSAAKATTPVRPEPPKPVPVVQAAGAPARATKPSARLAQITVPSMAQSVASTAAKSSYTHTMPPTVLPAPPLVAAKKDAKLANNWKSKPVEQLSDAEVLAMPDSEYMNDKQMAFFRLKLTQLKQDILNSAGETTEHLREDTVIVPDPADRATIEEEHALELRTRDRERKLLKKIEQSIQRIDAGDYGYCDETGEPIGVGRLLARPTATLSLEAQQRRELKQKMFGD
jgi:DnaK suppressor protein